MNVVLALAWVGLAILMLAALDRKAASLEVLACVAAQVAARDPQARCAQHAHRLRQHPHYEMPEGYGAGSMFVRP